MSYVSDKAYLRDIRVSGVKLVLELECMSLLTRGLEYRACMEGNRDSNLYAAHQTLLDINVSGERNRNLI